MVCSKPLWQAERCGRGTARAPGKSSRDTTMLGDTAARSNDARKTDKWEGSGATLFGVGALHLTAQVRCPNFAPLPLGVFALTPRPRSGRDGAEETVGVSRDRDGDDDGRGVGEVGVIRPTARHQRWRSLDAIGLTDAGIKKRATESGDRGINRVAESASSRTDVGLCDVGRDVRTRHGKTTPQEKMGCDWKCRSVK